MPSTILSHTGTRILTARPLDLLDYGGGLVLQRYSERGMGEILLDRAELLALLRVLPTADLEAVLTERGALLTLDLDAAVLPRAAGTVCVCDRHPSVHVADGACAGRDAAVTMQED